MLNNEKEGSTKWSIKLEVKIVQHCIQLTIAKNENISKGSVFVNSYCTAEILENFVFLYISQINLSDSSATQWVFNLKRQS